MVKIRNVEDNPNLPSLLILTETVSATDLSHAELHRQVVEKVQTEAGITAEMPVLLDRAEIKRVQISRIAITMEYVTTEKDLFRNDLL